MQGVSGNLARPVAGRFAEGSIMTPIDDDPFASPPQPGVHQVGEPLEAMSVEELRQRITALTAEIVRLEEALARKQETRMQAERFFRP